MLSKWSREPFRRLQPEFYGIAVLGYALYLTVHGAAGDDDGVLVGWPGEHGEACRLYQVIRKPPAVGRAYEGAGEDVRPYPPVHFFRYPGYHAP